MNEYKIAIIMMKTQNSSQRRVIYDSKGISPCLMAGMGGGGGIIPMVICTASEF